MRRLDAALGEKSGVEPPHSKEIVRLVTQLDTYGETGEMRATLQISLFPAGFSEFKQANGTNGLAMSDRQMQGNKIRTYRIAAALNAGTML